MSSDFSAEFKRALSRSPSTRTLEDLQTIYFGLHAFEALSCFKDSTLRGLCKFVKYERHQSNDILFTTGEFASCWYILISGAVFIDGSMFLPGSSFGRRNGGSARRPKECFVLEHSEMIVIEYPEKTTNKINTVNNQSQLLYHQEQHLQQVPYYYHQASVNQQSSEANHFKSPAALPPLLFNRSAGGAAAAAVSKRPPPSTQYPHHQYQAPYYHPVVVGPSPVLVAGCPPGRSLAATTMDGGHNPLRLNSIIYEDNNHLANVHRADLYQKCNRGSHSSDTSSAYSGSDTMTSIHSSTMDPDEMIDLSGLVESVVDSDEEDLAESMDSLVIRDTVRECLEKDPTDRNEDDIETLLEFTQKLKAFTSMTLTVRRAFCSVMVFAVVEKAGTVVMNDGEELDSWSVLINGHVEIEPSSGSPAEKEELQVGDSFGILPTMDKLYHHGVMRTKCDDCQFVCITQNDYYRILHQGEENTRRHESEDGHLVMVTELRDAGSARRGHVVIRGTPDRLMIQLIEENSVIDPTYVEDFLLTYRTFVDNPNQIAQQLLTWFENEDAPLSCTATAQEIRDRVSRVVLLWVNNSFTDFETDSGMIDFLETFIQALAQKRMMDQLRLLHIASASKARVRQVTVTRSSRDEDLHFQIVGGYEGKGNGGGGANGIFISHVDKRTKADSVGLKRGDQILEVNGQSFEHVTLIRAMEILKGTTHLSISVKSNIFAFRDVINPEEALVPRGKGKKKGGGHLDAVKVGGENENLSSMGDQTDCSAGSGGFVVPQPPPLPPLTPTSKKDGIHGFMTLGPKKRFQKALIKMNLLPKNMSMGGAGSGGTDGDDSQHSMSSSTTSIPNTTASPACASSNSSNTHAPASQSSSVGSAGGQAIIAQSSTLYQSQSNPDLSAMANSSYQQQLSAATAIDHDSLVRGGPDYPEHVLKIYKAPDQTCKYLLIHKETTAHEVVMLALQEFGIHDPSSNFSLCEVSVGEGGMVKQRRLPDQMQNLAERIGLGARYYLKTNGVSETLVPDEMAVELTRENVVSFLQLNANELAIQLTFQDFAIFRAIESTEYVDELFEIKTSAYGVQQLQKFAELVNREMFWVVTEVCAELNMVRRMKIMKKFIKIARFCKECRNFNSMFAIISGLSHSAVSRLRNTWEKVPSKYSKLFTDLQELMDPSRNMSKYRQLVNAELHGQHPIVPFYPIVKKDLTFIHLGNDTRIEGLINFEKLRMVSKEVRTLTQMCSSTYDFVTMLELRGQPPSSAMLALNQMSILQSIVGGQSGGGGGSGSNSQQGQGQQQNHHQGTGSNAHLMAANSTTTVKRRKKSAATPNPKKMFEEAQMVRRVKAFLNKIHVIIDEDQLHRMSIDCEPMNTSAPTSVTVRKRHPSPTLSTTSSTSSTSENRKNVAKFGAALLALSESSKIRPHQSKFQHGAFPGVVAGHVGGALAGSSPNPSPNSNRRTHQSSLSAVGLGTGAGAIGTHTFGPPPVRAVHERSHSDTSPLPSVDLSAESSSVTSLSSLAIRKAGSLTSTDSGNGSCSQASHGGGVGGVSDSVQSIPTSTSGCSVYHVASSIVHNSPGGAATAPGNMSLPIMTLNQRRHSAMAGSPTFHQANPGSVMGKPGLSSPGLVPLSGSSGGVALEAASGGGGGGAQQTAQYPHFSGVNMGQQPGYGPASVHGPPPPLPGSAGQPPPIMARHNRLSRSGPRMPPSYNVAAVQMARYHRMNRAHSHEGVVTPPFNPGPVKPPYYHTNETEEDEDEDTQVSAV